MNKNYYTDEYYYNEKNKYAVTYFDKDITEAIAYGYAAFCGMNLVETEKPEIPIIVFMSMAYMFLGKSLYDAYKANYIEEKHQKGEGLTKPLKLRRIKEYK